MDTGIPVSRYQFQAAYREGILEWSLGLETNDSARHELRIRDGEEIPILMSILQTDKSVYYHAESKTLRTGWNFPGGVKE
jgi:hypothetical protein